eukprot:739883-Rhodomonas_salina.2
MSTLRPTPASGLALHAQAGPGSGPLLSYALAMQCPGLLLRICYACAGLTWGCCCAFAARCAGQHSRPPVLWLASKLPPPPLALALPLSPPQHRGALSPPPPPPPSSGRAPPPTLLSPPPPPSNAPSPPPSTPPTSSILAPPPPTPSSSARPLPRRACTREYYALSGTEIACALPARAGARRHFVRLFG